jgi:hypothetical protein
MKKSSMRKLSMRELSMRESSGAFQVAVIFFVLLSLMGCGDKQKQDESMKRYQAMQAKEAAIDSVYGKLNETLTAVDATPSAVVLETGELLSEKSLTTDIKSIVNAAEIYKKEYENAMRDSTTPYGALLERRTYLPAQKKHVNAAYSKRGTLIEFRVEEGDETRNQWTFLVKDGNVLHAQNKRSETKDGQRHLTQDEFFIRDRKVIYAFRDQGSTDASKKGGVVTFITTDRYAMKGDANSAVAAAFETMKKEHDDLKRLEKIKVMLYTR